MDEPTPEAEQATSHVTDPAELLRIASMLQAMTNEARDTELDEAGLDRMRTIHDRAMTEVKDVISEDLAEELEELTVTFDDDTPSEATVHLAQAQLVGWLGGLFRAMQASASRQQQPGGGRQTTPGEQDQAQAPSSTGSYL